MIANIHFFMLQTKLIGYLKSGGLFTPWADCCTGNQPYNLQVKVDIKALMGDSEGKGHGLMSLSHVLADSLNKK